MAGSTVAKKDQAAVPALVNTPALEIEAEDVVLPRIYIGQFMSEAVKAGLVKAGSIFTASGAEDQDPQILAVSGKEGVALDDAVRVHVLGMRKGKSFSDGGELQLFDYNDPNAPADAWVTYNYTVCLPEVDTEVPYKWLLTRTGRQTAQKINTVLKKNEGKGPAWVNAFDFWTAKRSNQKGEFYVAQIAPVAADEANVAASQALGIAISGSTADYQSTGEMPAI